MSTNVPHGQSPSPYSQPPAGPPARNNTGLIVALVVGAVVAVPVLIACAGILVGLLLPAVQASREAARRMQCSNNMKQIALGLHNYHDTYGALPPAYTVDESGQRLHSWRTLILPFIEQQTLYSQIDLDKPWDDPANQMVAATNVPAYHCPSTPGDENLTTYVAVVDPAGVFSGSQSVQFPQISDGLSNTVMVAETGPDHAVPWMSPEDIDLSTFVAAGSDGHAHTGGANVAMADGAVRFLSDHMDVAIRQAVVTKDGQESVGGL